MRRALLTAAVAWLSLWSSAVAEVRMVTPAEVRGWQTRGAAVELVDCRHPEAFVEAPLRRGEP